MYPIIKKRAMKQFLILLLISCSGFSVEPAPLLKLAAGTALALGGHFLCEYMTTTCHELGHAAAYKIFTGESARITIQRGTNLLIPWSGQCSIEKPLENRLQKAIAIASGPLVGISTTFAQIHVLNALEDSVISQKSLKTPKPLSLRAYFKSLYDGTYTTTTDFLTDGKTPRAFENTLGIACKILKFLRYSRIVGETIYGFIPVGIPQGVGDGQILWSVILNNETGNTTLTDRLGMLTGAVMLSPVLLGLAKAVLHKNTNNKSST